jgi:phosphoribosylaminoimidazolecarboxamide formyltransferase/IMP cyclohydrolase
MADHSRRALISVTDKSGVSEFARALVDRGWEVLSTGGTARTLRERGLPVTDVAEVTGHPEMMEGRVKTLHPAVHAGLLARRDRPSDIEALEEQGYGPIDLVAVNLYPFRETVARGDVEIPEAMGQVDIGGPTMLRAAAKNHADVWVVVDPADYERVLVCLDGHGHPNRLRRALASKVFKHVSAYDAAIATYLADRDGADGAGGAEAEASGTDGADAENDAKSIAIPSSFEIRAERRSVLRYGENPDQAAGFYGWPTAPQAGLAGLEQLHGKALSYNNYLDLDGALLSLQPFAYSDEPAVCIVKHTTPCGLAVGAGLAEAYDKALRTDPVSAFGSVIALNRMVDAPTAERISQLFVECIVAPAFDPEAAEILTRKKNIRLLCMPEQTPGADELPPTVGKAAWWHSGEVETRRAALFLARHGRRPTDRSFRSVSGGVLVQTAPAPPYYGLDTGEWRVVTEREPSPDEERDLRFAWAAVFGVKSNAILLARDGATLGIGAGQMSRVDSSKLAVRKAGEAGLDLGGSALASDAFFPFRDGVDAAADAGVTAIVEPGGSIRDDEVIAAANEHGIAMVFTGRRLFRH